MSMQSPPNWNGVTEQFYLLTKEAREEAQRLRTQLVDQERAWRAEVEKRDKEIQKLRAQLDRQHRELKKTYKLTRRSIDIACERLKEAQDQAGRFEQSKEAAEEEARNLRELLEKHLKKRKL